MVFLFFHNPYIMAMFSHKTYITITAFKKQYTYYLFFKLSIISSAEIP